MSSITIIN